MGAKIAAAQSLSSSSNADIQRATTLVIHANTQSIALQTLPWRQGEPASLFNLKRARQCVPTQLLIRTHRIENRNPIQPLMAEPMTQSRRDSATELITMAAQQGRPTSVAQHQQLTSLLLYTNQVVTQLNLNLQAYRQQKPQHRKATPALLSRQ